MKKLLQSAFLAGILGLTGIANAQTTVQVTDADINAGDVVTWTADNEYVLNKIVFVEAGAKLFIEPGTVIRGAAGSNADASALVICRDAQIFAEGTADNPIIFTSVDDDGTLDATDRGLWGGVVILGNATTNNTTLKKVEGIGTLTPDGDDRAVYGGNNDADNSGVFRYVSIRHSGKNIGSESGNEIQGLTVGAVGNGTTIEFVESFASDDDGFEFFGGTVNTRYLVSAFNADDAFDWDQGFRGYHQFWFAIQAGDNAGRVAEMDGAGGNENTAPFAYPIVANATYIGAGTTATPSGDGEEMLMFRDNTGGGYINSIFTDFGSAAAGTAITVEDIDNTGSKPFDSRQRLENDSLILENNIWYGFKAGNTVAEFAPQDFVQTYLASANNTVADPMLMGIDREIDSKGLDPRPAAGSPALDPSNVKDLDANFTKTSYVGAFGGNNWLKGWTALDEFGILADVAAPSVVQVTDEDINAGDVVYWTADKEYVLNKIVFVEAGAKLFIEPGTVIKGAAGSNADASALVICRDAQIFAEGTADNPIIFTSVDDDGTLDITDRGLWGGLVILGNATTNNTTLKKVEGIGTLTPDGDDRAVYGGDNDADNSGVLRYVSIRHSGKNIGSESGNEIQGLTVGAVGNGTTIEYVESFASDDDGFEFFGGTVNTKYLVSAFNADDSFDWDQGFRGKHQFWFAIQAGDNAGRVAEMDGAGGNENTSPFAYPIVANATYIGAGTTASPSGDGEEMLMFRDNTGGGYINSVFTDFGSAAAGTAITVEDIDNTGNKPFDSRQRLENDSLILENNFWYGFKAGNTLAEFAPQDFVQTYLGGANNMIEDPMLRGIAREIDSRGLDPRPADGSPLWGAALSTRDAADFDQVDYAGAFGRTNWLTGWTALDAFGIIDNSIITSIEDEVNELPTSATLSQNYPNPFNPTTTISFSVPNAQDVVLKVYDVMGREVATLANQKVAAGAHSFNFDASNLSSGVYIYRLVGENMSLTRKMTLMK